MEDCASYCETELDWKARTARMMPSYVWRAHQTMGGWMGTLSIGWVDGHIEHWVGGWAHQTMGGWTDTSSIGWVDGHIEHWVGGWAHRALGG